MLGTQARTAPPGALPTFAEGARARARSLAPLLAGLAVVLLSLLAPRRADAYAWMIRHEYAACSTCHADPSGAGILTMYGRAQSEVLLRTRYGEVSDEEDPTKLGGFMFGAVPLPEQLMLQADVRSLLIHTRPPSPAPSRTRYVLMQADAAASLAVGPFRASGMLGYLHEGGLAASVTRGTEDRMVSRQHWAGVVFGKDEQFLLRAGRINVPFGLRLVEHTLLARVVTRSDINAAQQHGVSFAFNADRWRAEGMALLGNYQVRPDDVRERGVAGYLERAFGQALAVGATTRFTRAEYDLETRLPTWRQAHGLFGRYAVAKPVVLMAETDLLIRSAKGSDMDLGITGFVQADYEPTQGVHVAATGEALTQRFGDGATVGGWLSAFWFFLPHVDVRGDVIVQSVPFGTDRGTVTSFLAQFHGWL